MDNPTTSKFERLMGDSLKAFHTMIRGALGDWKGTYDVLLTDTQEYLLNAKKQSEFNPFCSLVRSYEAGESRCFQNDMMAIAKCNTSGRHVIGVCHAGLQDIAVPIIVNGEMIAVVFCGQVRPENTEDEQVAEQKARQLAMDLQVDEATLVELRSQVRQVKQLELQGIADRISEMASVVARMLEANLALAKAVHDLKSHEQSRMQIVDHSSRIERSVEVLIPLCDTRDLLWERIGQVLEASAKEFGATLGVFITQERRRTGRPMIRISSSSISRLHQSPKVFHKEPLFDDWDPGTMGLVTASTIAQESVLWEIIQLLSIVGTNTSSVFVMKVALGDTCRALLAYFYEDWHDGAVLIEMERANLQFVESRILQAFHNTNTHLNEVTEEEARREWLKVISHQIIAPLNGLIGHAETLQRYTRHWQRLSASFSDLPIGEIDKWNHSIDSILWTAQWAARITQNLAWIPDLESKANTVSGQEFSVIKHVPGYFIDIARLVQGMARDSELGKVHVVEASFSPMNYRLNVYSDYFQQAIMNILDNAVKYADKRTDITIRGKTTTGHGRIMISNIGARLRDEDCERIFDNGFRTDEARQRYATGTGIGLTIARKIVDLHGGRLSVEPSVLTEQGWQTTFTIILPLQIRR